MKPKQDKKAPYLLEVNVERAVAVLSCTDPRFWAVVGHAVEPDRLRDPVSSTLVQAARVIAKKTGGGSSNPLVTVQHLTNLQYQGKLELDTVAACKDYLLDGTDLTGDEVVAVVAPVIKRAIHMDALKQGLADFKADADPSRLLVDLERATKIGVAQQVSDMASLQEIISDASFFHMEKREDLFSLGVPEVDAALGGIERRSISLFIGGTGAGKSMALAHVAAESLLEGHDTVYVTLELSKTMVTHRIVRNLINMTKEEMHLDASLARERVRLLMAEGLGQLMVAYAEPIETSPRAIRALIKEYQRAHRGFEPRVFVIDFVDKIRINKRDEMHADMLAVMDGCRSMAVEADGWAWTASQSNRQAVNRPWPDVDSVADSLNKIRSADVAIGIGRTEDDQSQDLVRFSIPKRREGEGAHSRIGPLPWDPARGRISVVTRDYPW